MRDNADKNGRGARMWGGAGSYEPPEPPPLVTGLHVTKSQFDEVWRLTTDEASSEFCAHGVLARCAVEI